MIDTSQLKLIARSNCVWLIASQDNFFGSWHLTWLYTAWRLLKGDLLVVAVESFLTVYAPWALRLALDARARFEILILSDIKRSTRKVAFSA
jgi:hypothetical protein